MNHYVTGSAHDEAQRLRELAAVDRIPHDHYDTSRAKGRCLACRCKLLRFDNEPRGRLLCVTCSEAWFEIAPRLEGAQPHTAHPCQSRGCPRMVVGARERCVDHLNQQERDRRVRTNAALDGATVPDPVGERMRAKAKRRAA